MPYLLIADPSSGSAEDDLPTRARGALPDVRTIELTPDVDLASEIRRGIEEERVIVACGATARSTRWPSTWRARRVSWACSRAAR